MSWVGEDASFSVIGKSSLPEVEPDKIDVGGVYSA